MMNASSFISVGETDRVEHGADKVAVFAFIMFLVLVFIGTNIIETGVDNDADAGGGRILLFVIGFCITIIKFGTGRLVALVSKMPRSLICFIMWCSLSSTWAIVPYATLTRLGLGLVVMGTVFMAIDSLGYRTTVKIFFYFILFTLTADILSLFFFRGAIHLSGERDADLVGLWRGLHPHKNIAGSVSAVGILLALYTRGIVPKIHRLYTFVISIVFTVGSWSKTSIAVMTAAIVLSSAIEKVASSGRYRLLFGIFGATLGISLVVLVLNNGEYFQDILDDRNAFTGRTVLWKTLIDYWSQYPWTGSGFESFWRLGDLSPAAKYATSPMTALLAIAPHGHNGYLDILASTGTPGFILGVIAFAVMPLAMSWRLIARGNGGAKLGFTLILYVIFHNFFESSILKGSRVGWFVWCVGMALILNEQRKRQETSNVRE